jgi:ribulose-5-phosphate 4-epimerase/fuculose-1-phosphate aldolase
MIIGHILYKDQIYGIKTPHGLFYCGHADMVAIVLAICEQEHIREWATCMMCLQHEKRQITRREDSLLGGCGHYCEDLIYQYIKQPTTTTNYKDWQGQNYDYTGRKA